MYRVHVKYRGRDIAVHTTESHDEAQELERVYWLLGYSKDRVVLEDCGVEQPLAA